MQKIANKILFSFLWLANIVKIETISDVTLTFYMQQQQQQQLEQQLWQCNAMTVATLVVVHFLFLLLPIFFVSYFLKMSLNIDQKA